MAKPSSPEASDAYRRGLCKTCLVGEQRAGSPECEDCYDERMESGYGWVRVDDL